ncbi:unnamed protein product [Pylaiella littoralis]
MTLRRMNNKAGISYGSTHRGKRTKLHVIGLRRCHLNYYCLLQRQRQDLAAARASSLTLKNEKLLTHVSRQLCHICLPVSFTSAGTSVAVVFPTHPTLFLRKWRGGEDDIWG